MGCYVWGSNCTIQSVARAVTIFFALSTSLLNPPTITGTGELTRTADMIQYTFPPTFHDLVNLAFVITYSLMTTEATLFTIMVLKSELMCCSPGYFDGP